MGPGILSSVDAHAARFAHPFEGRGGQGSLTGRIGTVPRVIDIALHNLHQAAGIGVAGNFAGHLEQAGEAADFVNVVAESAQAPKGIFPWHMPGRDGYLGVFPLSADAITWPERDHDVDLQIEPEVGAICRLTYDAGGRVTSIAPEAVAAFNDCSIRVAGAPKISQKKNWAPASKGLAARGFAVADLDPAGGLATLRIACFLRRDGVVHEYGIDSPARGYSYAGTTLVDWIIERLANQQGSPDTPLEPVGQYLRDAGCPQQVVFGIGATRYTAFGEANYLRPGDESIVIVYDERVTSPAAVAAAVQAGDEGSLPEASVLVQVVRPG